ncbi:hypothetical protein SSM1_168 [Synechococcus phage S-SM1]|uniref:Gp166 n=1 Tax=Synechococcus phage S-SM1 TaxID=444859 RepID=E3SIH5_9CAUD|nr:hypothetical protein SSM1_168 [Synechococcus phage S-SM1]ADO97182.1 hypothetical protein SSM1_168 [Synechococcus phage S-SM1]
MMTLFGKTIFWSALSVAGAFVILAPAQAVPVVPNFQQGQMTTHTETTSEVVEVINSMDYNTGYTYSVSGHGVEPSGGNIAPSGTQTQSVRAPASTTNSNGISSTWTGLNMGTRPTWSQSTPGGSFSFVESYMAPGLSNHTIIERTTTIQSVTDTTSIFTQ